MHVNYTYDIEPYSVDSTKRLVFSLDNSALSVPATMHCRLDGHLCAVCYASGSQIFMSMPLLHGIEANRNHLVMLSTRGADGSATTREGLSHL